jgi:hypothetical protein
MLRRGRRRFGLVALVLALVVPGASLARALPPPPCKRCAPSCPMHAKGRLGCHDGGTRRAGGHGCHDAGPGLRGGCCLPGQERSAVSVEPGVLPPVLVCARGPRPARCRVANPQHETRPAERPDTPPPIVLD